MRMTVIVISRAVTISIGVVSSVLDPVLRNTDFLNHIENFGTVRTIVSLIKQSKGLLILRKEGVSNEGHCRNELQRIL